MAWDDIFRRVGSRDWLLEVAGSGKVSEGERLDPFGTSWRVLSTQARRWLPLLQEGQPIPGSRRPDQALSDLRAANLVQADGRELTPLGQAVLDSWQHLRAQWSFE